MKDGRLLSTIRFTDLSCSLLTSSSLQLTSNSVLTVNVGNEYAAPSGAKALVFTVCCGTAEAVPYPKTYLTQIRFPPLK